MNATATRYVAIGNAKSCGGYAYVAVYEWLIHVRADGCRVWVKGDQLSMAHTKGAKILDKKLAGYADKGFRTMGTLKQYQTVPSDVG